jgi:predicted dithiol-disulfide oxidoreductase (DUF899 family)
VVSQEEWLAARKRLLAREKEVTRLRDAVNAERRRLPMVKVDKDYVFSGPQGKLTLLDMFEGRRQLYIHHFMWIDARDEGCPGCTMAADVNFTPVALSLLHRREVSFACVARAPLTSITRYKNERGWTFPFFSSHGSDFNYDFHVTLEATRAPLEYNYLSKAELNQRGLQDDVLHGDWTGASVFLRDGDAVFHTYSAYARGLDAQAPGYSMLDLTPYGRQEAWEDSPPGWPQQPTPQ